MNLARRLLLGCVGMTALASPFSGQTPTPDKSGAEVSFQFEHASLPVPRFTIQLHEDGSGRYRAEQVEPQAMAMATATAAGGQPTRQIDRTMELHLTTVTKIFKAARELNHFNVTCASKAKNIANTGKKTLTYEGSDGRGSCVYNFSEDKRVTTLSDTFLAIAYTLDAGRKLEYLHRYDRLGLDAEMNTLMEEAEAGRAQELGTISQTLTEIAGDMAVMQRVRERAARLLEQAN